MENLNVALFVLLQNDDSLNIRLKACIATTLPHALVLLPLNQKSPVRILTLTRYAISRTAHVRLPHPSLCRAYTPKRNIQRIKNDD